LYLVLTARPLVGVRVALLPLQATLLAAISPNPTGLRRKVCLSIDLHFIGRLKFTVIPVWTSTSTAPLFGLVDTTTGRDFFDAAAADDPAIHRISASIVIETRVTVFLRTIVPCFDSARICPNVNKARSMPEWCVLTMCRSSREKVSLESQRDERNAWQVLEPYLLGSCECINRGHRPRHSAVTNSFGWRAAADPENRCRRCLRRARLESLLANPREQEPEAA
jgi:hypothetical protein